MISKVVSDTGPLLHISEIEIIKALDIFKEINIPEEVKNELNKNKIILDLFHNLVLINLKPKFKIVTEILINKFSLDIGEAEAISLALQEKTEYFLTDDLEARTVASIHNLKVHGTVGIILRAFRENIIKKETALNKVIELYTESSLFITKDLIDYIIKSINEFKTR